MKKLGLKQYTSQLWESLQANILYKNFIAFKDVYPVNVPYKLTHNNGGKHEIVLKPGSKYCVMQQ